jgi:hypothetical protein
MKCGVTRNSAIGIQRHPASLKLSSKSTRVWSLAGARIGEIIARKLTLNQRIERLVWSRQTANGYYR